MGYYLEPETHTGLIFDQTLANQPGGETVHLLSRSSQREVQLKLRELENKAWFDPKTAKIEILLTTYNAHEDIFTGTYIMMFHNRMGHIHKMIEPISIWIDPYKHWWAFLPDIMWALCVLKMFIDEGRVASGRGGIEKEQKIGQK